MVILLDEPAEGNVVIVNALAGCSKTTTIALLCYKIKEDHSREKTCLYLVYNKTANTEATKSNKFPKMGMDIRTSYSWVLRNYFGMDNMSDVSISVCKYSCLLVLPQWWRIKYTSGPKAVAARS